MILVSALVDRDLYDVIQKHQVWIEETFVSEYTEESFSTVVNAVRTNNPTAFILLIVPPAFEEIARTLPVNDICVYDGTDIKAVESRIIYQGSPAVHRLVDSYKRQLSTFESQSSASEEVKGQLARLDELQSKLNDSTLEINARDTRITELEGECKRLTGEIEKMNAQKVESDMEIGATRMQEDTRHREAEAALQRKITELTEERAREIAQMSDAVQSRDETIEQLNTTLAEANAQIELLRKSSESVAPVTSDESYQKMQRDFLEAQRELISLRGENESLRHELAGNNVTIEALQNQQQLHKSELDAANARAEASKKALEGVQRSIGDSSTELIRLRAENAQLHQDLLVAGENVNTSNVSRELTLGLAKYTGNALIIGVCGYGSSYYTANVAASIANSLGNLSDVAIIDLDPCYSSINSFYNTSRFTATLGDKKAPYVTALNEKAQFASGLKRVKQNKSGSVLFGGGTLGGIQKLNEDRFVEELNGLSATVSYIVLNLGCISTDMYGVLGEISVAGKLVCVVDGEKMPVKFMAGQLAACSIPARDVSWVLVSDNPVTDTSITDDVLTGANMTSVAEVRANSRVSTLEIGQFGRTFGNFVSVLSQ